MEKDLITKAIQDLVIKEGKGITEVQYYLRMKYGMEIDCLVLDRRLEKLLLEEKAVA